MKAHGQAILNISGTLYGLFIIADASFTTYANSVLVRFSITAGVSITVDANDYNNGFDNNSFQMAVSGSELFVAAIGRVQAHKGYKPTLMLRTITFGAPPFSIVTVTKLLLERSSYPDPFRAI